MSEVTQDFSVDILADVPDLPYNLEGSWSIISSNAAFAIEDFQNDSTSRYTFTQPGRYTLQYSALIDGTDSDCEYETTHEFNVGVDSKINDDYSSKICVGGDNFIAQYDDSFDTWSNLEEWLWSTTSDLIISDSTSAQTNLSIVTPIPPDSSVIYDLKLRLTTEVGCWEEDSVTIEGYQVHADFFTLDTVVYCAPNEILIRL